MVNKKFIVFKVAVLSALFIALGALLLIFYLFFGNKTIKINSIADTWQVVILLFLFLTGIGFQLKNIWLIVQAKKEDFSCQHFLKYHSILLICNSLGTICIGIVLFSMIFDLYSKESNHQPTPLLLFWFCTIWFLSNVLSIIGSLQMRSYLLIRQIRKDKASLENFGKQMD